MKNRNNIYTTTLVALAFAFAFALGTEASRADGGPTYQFSTASSNGNNDAENRPVIAIHSTDNVTRGNTGSFVLEMRAALDSNMRRLETLIQ